MKKFISSVIISIFFFCGESYGQFNSVWDVSYQHTVSDYFSNESRKVEVDASGNAFVLADVTSDIDPNGVVTTSTWHYTVLLKYSSSGTLLFEQNIQVYNHVTTGFNINGAFALELDAAGNVYAGYNVYDNGSNYDVYVLKLDNNLNVLWSQKYNPTSIDYGVDMKIDPSGIVYAIAQSVSGTNSTYHIIKSDAANLTLNSIYAFDVNMDYLSHLVLDGSQNNYVTGYRIISGFKSVLTASVSNTGALHWKVTYNGGSSNRDDFGNNLTIGVDGNLYVTGISDRGAPTNNDMVIIKYNTNNGKNYWATFHDYNNGNDNGRFVVVSDINYVYVGSQNGNVILMDRIQTFSGTRIGRGVYQPDPAEQYSTLNGAILRDFKVSSNMNFYIIGSILATDLNSQLFEASFLARFVLNPQSRSIFKLDSEESVEGNFNKSYSGVGVALDYLNDDLIWIRNKYQDFSNHQQETIQIIGYDVPVPLKLTSSSDFTGVSADIIYHFPSENILSVSSTLNLFKLEITDLSGRKMKEFYLNSPLALIDVGSLNNGVYLTIGYAVNEEVIYKKIVKQ